MIQIIVSIYGLIEEIWKVRNRKWESRKWEIKKRRKCEIKKRRKWETKKRKWEIKKKKIENKDSIEKPKEIKSPEEDKNATDSYFTWFDTNKFKSILAIIDSKKFNYRHKIGEFRYIEIKDLVNNIKNDIISEISAKKSLNALNETKNAGMIKYKKPTPRQKELWIMKIKMKTTKH